MQLNASSWSPEVKPVASIPMISSACSTVKQSTASETGWKPPGSWAPDKLAYSLGRRVLLIVAGGPERACPCSWLVFTLMWPPFKLSPRSTPPLFFFSCFLWRGPRRCPRRKTDAVFLSDSPVEGTRVTGWTSAELWLGGGVLYWTLSLSELARFQYPLSGEGIPPEKPTSAPQIWSFVSLEQGLHWRCDVCHTWPLVHAPWSFSG